MQYVVIGSRCLVGLVFAVAAVSKLRSRAAFGEFAESVRALRLVGDRQGLPVAVAVATGEALIAVLMVAPRPFAAAGFVLGATLLTVFAVMTIKLRGRGVYARCRCFGTGRTVLGGVHAARNLTLAVAAVVGAIGLAAGSQQGPDPGGSAIAVVAGVVLALLAIALDDVLTLFRPQPSGPTRVPRGTSR